MKKKRGLAGHEDYRGWFTYYVGGLGGGDEAVENMILPALDSADLIEGEKRGRSKSTASVAIVC